MSNEFIPVFSREALQDKVFVLAGGSTGIGAALFTLLGENGAYVVVGDVNETGAETAKNLRSKYPSASASKPRAIFRKSDVSNYEDNIQLFELALKTFGRVDHAIANAGIGEIGNWFDPNLTRETVKNRPPTKVLDIDLIGYAYFARIAAVYLKENRSRDEDRSITLVSSCAGFKDTPGMFVYTAAKHGVLGLMRSLRPYLPESHKIRVNTVSPWMTVSAIAAGVVGPWKEAGLPANDPIDVANVMAGIVVDKRINGKNMYIAGKRAWETEDGLLRTEPQWLGEVPSTWLAKGQEILGNGTSWGNKP